VKACGRRSGDASNRNGELYRSLGISHIGPDGKENLTHHSWRHRIKTVFCGLWVPERIHDAVTGHSTKGSASRGYGTVDLKTMADAIERLPSILGEPETLAAVA